MTKMSQLIRLQRIKACDAKPEYEGADDTFDTIDTVFYKPFAYICAYTYA